jgi:2-polyprenyl-3-methyl-5-hydroxy-6-metoxy-1,4-benzoquinol methylase
MESTIINKTDQIQTWEQANQWERQWHGDCANSYNEETKQYIYARLMGLDKYAVNYYGQRGWDFGDQSVLDIGCGPYSILLKSKATLKVGVDPCPYPEWVKMRYKECGVEFYNIKGEEINCFNNFDECLIYNCLQHTEDPQKILQKAWENSKVIRIFEWINEPVSDGHIHVLTEEKLNAWLSGEGKVIDLNQDPCVGRAYYGIFPGLHYNQNSLI